MIEIKEVRDLTPGEKHREDVIKECLHRYQTGNVQPVYNMDVLRSVYDEGFYDGYKRKEGEMNHER